MRNNEELKQENLALKQSIENLNQELIRVNKLLSDSEALKSHFISNITNEIVNPFASILGLTESLKDMEKKDFDQAMFISGRIHKEALDLNYQLTNVFAAAKLEAGLFIVEPSACNITDLLQDVFNTYESELSKKKINFQKMILVENEIVVTDAEKLKLILSNLISNAIKYTPENGKIEILIQQDESLKFSIQDTGVGFKEDQLQALFERFRQLDEEINTINKGYGLGLSVVKACIDLLDGELKIESTLNVGSEFCFELPVTVGEVMEDYILFDEDGIF